MYYHIFITGCQYNYYDAKKIAHLFKKMGYVYVNNDKKADVIVALVCSVRQKPLDRIYGKIKKWRALSQKPKIIITGCVLPNDKKKLVDKVDAIIKTENVEKKLVKLLKKSSKKSSTPAFSLTKCKSRSGEFRPLDINKNTALVPIMQGCNNFCTYCVVPYVRGSEKSRLMTEIIAEIKSELKSGKKHILLLGQNVNSYNSDKRQVTSNENPLLCHSRASLARHREFTNKKLFLDSCFRGNDNFTELLKKIDRISGNFTYNFLSANPRDFSDKLIETLPKLKKWQLLLHLPLQSGDNQILKAMNRKYSVKKYLTIIENCKLKILASPAGGKNLSVTTDLMVGFPGETKTQFENTVNLCKKIGFAKAYINQYSPRPGTFTAKNFPDNISKEEKKRRWEVLNILINQKPKNKNRDDK